MFDFSTFKNKRYWILLIPFILIILAIFTFAPLAYTTHITIVVVIIFWIVYYLWNRQSNK